MGETGLQVQKETGSGMKSRQQARKSQAVDVKGRELKARSKVNQEWAEQGEEKTGNEGIQARLWLCENQKNHPQASGAGARGVHVAGVTRAWPRQGG